MTRIRAVPKRHAPRPATTADRHRKALVATIISIATASAATAYIHGHRRLDPDPYHTSSLTGQEWVRELQDGHFDRMRDNIGIAPHIFTKLKHELMVHGGLVPRRHVGVDEIVATFLYQAMTNLGVRQVGERFQRSTETVSRNFHDTLQALVSDRFRAKYMQLPDSNRIPYIIASNPRFFPYFKDARAAIDGSHVFARPPAADKIRFRDRSGNITFNVLAACDWSMIFVYLLVGWEGSIADSLLYQEALKVGLDIPDGTYWLADAGFPNCDKLLVPYRNTRYHLREWLQAGQRPANKEELFNLRHSQLRNVIERIFGVIKRRWKMIRETSEYPLPIQSLIPLALCILHNFISIYEPPEPYKIPAPRDMLPQSRGDTVPSTGVSDAETVRATNRRDTIAEQMWADYQAELARRGH